MAIDRIGSTPASAPLSGVPAPDGSATGFGDALRSVLDAVDGSTADANEAVGRMLQGTGDVHEAMIALQRADTLLQLTVQVRNKIVQAYQDIMRMPI